MRWLSWLMTVDEASLAAVERERGLVPGHLLAVRGILELLEEGLNRSTAETAAAAQDAAKALRGEPGPASHGPVSSPGAGLAGLASGMKVGEAGPPRAAPPLVQLGDGPLGETVAWSTSSPPSVDVLPFRGAREQPPPAAAPLEPNEALGATAAVGRRNVKSNPLPFGASSTPSAPPDFKQQFLEAAHRRRKDRP